MTQPTLDPPNFEKRAGQYVKLRDMKKAIEDKHKEELKPINETLEQLNGVLLAHLNTVGADSVATALGTVSKTTKKTASIADMSAFWNFVVSQGDFDLLDKKANVTAVEAYIEANKSTPPGINFSTVEKVNVRRKTGT